MQKIHTVFISLKLSYPNAIILKSESVSVCGVFTSEVNFSLRGYERVILLGHLKNREVDTVGLEGDLATVTS